RVPERGAEPSAAPSLESLFEGLAAAPPLSPVPAEIDWFGGSDYSSAAAVTSWDAPMAATAPPAPPSEPAAPAERAAPSELAAPAVESVAAPAAVVADLSAASATPATPVAAALPSLTDAFAALLAAEQGDAHQHAPVWPAGARPTAAPELPAD